MRSAVYLGNVLCCRPTNNKITTVEAYDAISCCLPGLYQELLELKPKAIIALGATALNAFVPDNFGIRRERGSVRIWNGIPLVATYHPSAIMRSMEQVPIRGEVELSSQILRPVWIADLKKAKKISESEWSPPDERFIIYPSIKMVEELVSRVKGKPLAVDIETSGDRIWCVGIAWSKYDAMCIPFFKKGGEPYWNDIEGYKVREYLHDLLASSPLIFQNAKFDVAYLEEHGYSIPQIVDDTMLLHHAVSPEFPHDLGFIVSQYGDTPYWKGEMKFKDTPVHMVDDEDLRTYNCRDSVVLHQVREPMLDELKKLGEKAEDVYRNITLPLIRPVMDMERQGLKVSQSRLKKFKEDLHDEIGQVERGLRQEYCLPESFNFDSDDDVRFLLFGTVAPKFLKAEELLPTKKKKDTKVYKELSGLVAILELVTPLGLGTLAKGRTGSGRLSVSDDGLLSVTRAITARTDLIAKFKRPTEEHKEEALRLARGLKFIAEFQRRNELAKLISTYSSFPVDGDSRIHPSYLLHGTATGRLSSKNPNIQNQPDVVRKVFITEENNEFISADYSNLELRVLAVVANDKRLLEIFASGASVHDVLTMELFGVGPEDHRFKVYKRAEKTFVFGRNYGGTLKGIYERLIRQVPECGLSFARFVSIDERFRSTLPGVERWTQETISTVASKRQLENCFGRIRVFWGSEYDIRKEGLNFPIQSAAADIINQATIGIWKAGLAPVCQIHDQLLFEVPSNEVEDRAKVIKHEMEREFTINGQSIRFPVELSRGRSWGELATFSI